MTTKPAIVTRGIAAFMTHVHFRWSRKRSIGGDGFAQVSSALIPYLYGVQYAADGRKLRSGRMASDEAGMPFEAPTDYVGNLVYKDGVLDKILVDGGYISGSDMNYRFFVTDHLGNVRVVVTAAGVIEQENEFYPYGESIDTDVQFTSDNPYKWGSKEWDADQGAYDFGARMYFPTDACWSTMDPLCEKYYHISPYAYCMGNPIRFVDTDGRIPRVYIETNGVGHTFVTVGEGKNTIVYSYGRYGALGSSGSVLHSYTPSGEGVLNRHSGDKALQYIEKEMNKGNLSVFVVSNADDQSVSEYLDALWESGTTSPALYDPDDGRVVDAYNLLSNNCTTKAINAIVPILSPKQLKSVLDTVSKEHPEDIIKVDNPQEFFMQLVEQFK